MEEGKYSLKFSSKLDPAPKPYLYRNKHCVVMCVLLICTALC